MLSVRVIGAVHGQGDWVVVHGHIRLPVCSGYASAGAATAGEQVYYQLFLKGQTLTWLGVNEVGFLLVSGHRGSLPGIFGLFV